MARGCLGGRNACRHSYRTEVNGTANRCGGKTARRESGRTRTRAEVGAASITVDADEREIYERKAQSVSRDVHSKTRRGQRHAERRGPDGRNVPRLIATTGARACD